MVIDKVIIEERCILLNWFYWVIVNYLVDICYDINNVII